MYLFTKDRRQPGLNFMLPDAAFRRGDVPPPRLPCILRVSSGNLGCRMNRTHSRVSHDWLLRSLVGIAAPPTSMCGGRRQTGSVTDLRGLSASGDVRSCAREAGDVDLGCVGLG